MRKTTVIVIVLLSVFGAKHACSQEISYNLDPMYELGEELWAIPIGGELTMSSDGSRLLIASKLDSAFFVVDVETGVYRRLSQPFYQDNTFGYTTYTVDNDLTTLSTTNLIAGRPLNAWDIDKDSLIYSEDSLVFGATGGVSGKYERIVNSSRLIDLDSKQVISTNEQMGFRAWFDDERGVFYCSRQRRVAEFDTETGDVIRDWGVRSTRSIVRRPQGSDWLYVFSLDTDVGNPYNSVEAINLSSGERLIFYEYFWGIYREQPVYDPGGWFYSTSSGQAISSGRNNDLGKTHHNAIWKFDADMRQTNVVFDGTFVFNGRETRKRLAINPELSLLAHVWNSTNRDSVVTRLNALVPVATSVEQSERESNTAPCTFTNAPAFIYNVLGEVVATVDFVDDRIAPHQLAALPQQPLWVMQGACARPVPGACPRRESTGTW